MGTEVHRESSFEGYYSMRDNEDSNSSGWPLFYGEKSLTPGHYYNGFVPRISSDANAGRDKDAVKQKMLEHEAIFKNQVYELHRLYRRQRDMMEEVKRNEYHKHRFSIDTSSSSSLLPSQKPYEDGQKWQIPSFPMVNSCSRSIGNNGNNNGSSLKDCEIMENRPSKVRKKLFDLELPPDDNVDQEQEHEEVECKQASEESSYKDTSSRKSFKGHSRLADLNEPVKVEEPMAHGSVDGLGPSFKPKGSPFLGPARGLFEKPQLGAYNPLLLDNSRFPALSATSPSPYMNPADWDTARGKRNGSLTHKLTSLQRQPSFLSSPSSHVVFGDKWRMNGCYTPNGFHHGSSSGLKDPRARLPSGGFDRQNYITLDDRSQKIQKGSNFIDLTGTTKGIDLNNDSNSSRKREQTVPSWLQAKPNLRKNDSLCNDPVDKGPSGFGNSCVSKNDTSSLVSTSASLRWPRENGKLKTETENRGFDINIAWDADANREIEVEDCNIGGKIGAENGKIKNNFDLNSCLTEDEDVIVPESVKSPSDTKKITMEIDLEIPALTEAEEEAAAAVDDEFFARVAAEAIVALTGISGQQTGQQSSQQSSQQDQAESASEVARLSDNNNRLVWFAEVVENAGFVNERDEYEELTLQQELTKEEDYMPKPLAPDFQEPDETGLSTGPSRPRRGQARRGRPRRDFQRDILPGLVSLSRHEVTEDLQVFGGLMRATGHSWNVGPARRNGTRGRRKSMVAAKEPSPPSTTPPRPPPPPPTTLSAVVGLEERSLTGWGKTTRRPRRQRCGAGPSVAVPPT